MACERVEKFVNFMMTLPMFQALEFWQIRLLYNDVNIRRFVQGEMVVHEEDPCSKNGFFIIFSGRVKVFSVDDKGEQIYAILGKGDFFGEMSILEEKPRSASVAALHPCEIFVWDCRAFIRMLEKYPSISLAFMRILSERLRRANRRINNFSFMSARERLIVYLREEVHRRGILQEDGTYLIEIPPQKAIGSTMGIARETVSRVFAEFAEDGIIIKKGYKKVLVPDETLLQI
ncbi:Crp/Fnr family transcriptional regulator [Chitinivibrio alkaliphilus]|uniref:Crp/Fnr family transcriptional regulator n=1 Tax=Chitinivibrio alkaliphilus ACht1 TaxID=1313304 RepID=U7DAC5_9BACT|nr:Crp/Fnr family transcriptional regulator [Chitinivibrio alkaliphilus]ERP38982.1 Crp/Fnr family transcriptional regulator [Chitinivibrio alkaliphilus ACht1]